MENVLPGPARQAVIAALEQLLGWPELARSPQLGRFLDYIVTRTLDGDSGTIKAYSIAVDVLGRAPDFDPQVDPIVRVQARRLRSLLDEYYRGPGAADPVRISLPIGRYVPEFVVMAHAAPQAIEAPTPLEPEQPAAPRRAQTSGFAPAWFALAGIAVLIAALAYVMGTWGPRISQAVAVGALQQPNITIVEFQNLTGQPAEAPQVAGLAIELVTDLEQFEDISVHYGGPGEVAEHADLHYVLTGIVRQDADSVQYSAILTDATSSAVVWNKTITLDRATAMEPTALDRVSLSLSLVLGSPRGPLHQAARSVLTSGASIEGRETLYLCRMLFDLYRETGGLRLAQRANDCFAALPETERQDALALAASASLLSEKGLSSVAITAEDRMRIASASLDQAIAVSPISSFVWEQHARLHETAGDLAGARAAYGSSIQLNPANTDALAAFARLLALNGQLEMAGQLSTEAVYGSPEPPAWYFAVPTLEAMQLGDFAGAVEAAERYAAADRELGPVLAVLAAQRGRDEAVVNRYLPQILDVPSFRGAGVLPTLRKRITDRALIDQIRVALLAAGLPNDALTLPF